MGDVSLEDLRDVVQNGLGIEVLVNIGGGALVLKL